MEHVGPIFLGDPKTAGMNILVLDATKVAKDIGPVTGVLVTGDIAFSGSEPELEYAVVHSRPAIRKVVAVLDDDRDTRPYLKSLRKAVEASSIGTREQRDALLEGR
jgi:hypothetical protein